MKQEDSKAGFVKKCVEKYRSKLLDTSRRNNLISFSHSERSRQHVRVIDEQLDCLYSKFLNGKTLVFRSLPEEDLTFSDEKTPVFRHQLEQAKLTDDEYRKAIDVVDENEDGALDKIKDIERDLKNKIRRELNFKSVKSYILSFIEFIKFVIFAISSCNRLFLRSIVLICVIAYDTLPYVILPKKDAISFKEYLPI